MIDKILDYLSRDVNDEAKFHFIKEKITSYCRKEKHIFQCYRIVKYLELELQDLLDDSKSNFQIDKKIILKILKVVRTEIEIAKIRMRFAHNLEDIGEGLPINVPRLQWTDTKTDLVELIYAVKSSVDDGNVTLKKITECFEYIFQIQLGNIYDKLNEISLRKLDRTRYINKLMENFNRVLDKMDS